MSVISSTYYVIAKAAGAFASTQYFVKNNDGSYTQVESPLRVPQSSSACTFIQHPDSLLNLQATVFKTLPVVTGFSDNNYAPASGGEVAVTMPTSKTVTKGVLLMFADTGGVQLFSSSDPTVINNPD